MLWIMGLIPTTTKLGHRWASAGPPLVKAHNPPLFKWTEKTEINICGLAK